MRNPPNEEIQRAESRSIPDGRLLLSSRYVTLSASMCDSTHRALPTLETYKFWWAEFLRLYYVGMIDYPCFNFKICLFFQLNSVSRLTNSAWPKAPILNHVFGLSDVAGSTLIYLFKVSVWSNRPAMKNWEKKILLSLRKLQGFRSCLLGAGNRGQIFFGQGQIPYYIHKP